MRLSEYIPTGARLIKDGEYRAMQFLDRRLTSKLSLFVYIKEKKYLSLLKTNKNISCVLCTEEIFEFISQNNYGIMISKEPRADFFEVHNYHSKNIDYVRKQFKTKIHPSSKLHSLANVSENNVKIGENCIIEEFVSIKENVTIGNNTTIRSGVLIGSEGFYVAKHEGCAFLGIHLGGVLIGDNVEIQSNSVIVKAFFPLDDTVIGEYTKIDSLVEIAHGCKIGKRCLITGGTVVAGATIISDDVFVGPNSTITNRTTIGNSAFIGIGSVVIGKVSENKKVFGNPARSLPPI
jgi:UDP-3-O-[3-hydroxymyristoyl] glucosamine N-acyltransferase